jgi:putative ABC transport system permease protein
VMWRRILALFRSGQMDRDFESELETHVSLLEEELRKQGLTPDEARRAARLQLGAVTSLKEQHREARGMLWLESIWQDFRYAMRRIAKDPWFAAAAVGALALGIGVNTVGFTIVNTAFIKGLQAKDGDRLITPCWPVNCRLSPDQLELLRGPASTVDAWEGFAPASVNLGDERGFAERHQAAWITGNLFALLGFQPVLGRNLSADDDRAGAPPVVLISHEVWANRYGRDQDVLGTALRINGRPATIVGVMPEGFGFPEQQDLWAPLQVSGLAKDNRRVEVVGRMRESVEIDQVRAELAGVVKRMAAAFPDSQFRVASVRSFRERGLGEAQAVFWLVMGAVCFVLLIACANVANLLLSRSAYRTREMTLRLSLGATRWRLVRQLLLESLILAFLGGVLGLTLAMAGVPLFEASLPAEKPYWLVFTVDYTVIAYVAGACVATTLLFGLAPALQLSKSAAAAAEGGRGSVGGRRLNALSSALVITELMLTIVLLAGAGLLGRSFYNMYSLDLGFAPAGLVMFSTDLAGDSYKDVAKRRDFVDRLEENIAAIPGVEAVATATAVPPRDHMEQRMDLDRPGWMPPFISTVAITPRFFDALGVPILRGRNFTAQDGQPGSETVLINERLAQRFFPGQDPVGQRLRFAAGVRPGLELLRPAGQPGPWRTIVGVTRTIRQGSYEDSYLNAVVYTPYREQADLAAQLIVRSGLAPGPLFDAIRRTLRSMDPDQPVREAMTLEEWMGQERWPFRVFGSLFLILAAISLGLSSLGLYAVMANAVARRTPEIGVRMAIGARPREIVWLVLRRGFAQVAIGLALGTTVGVLLSQVMTSLLAGVKPGDPAVFTGVAVVTIIVATAACLIPVRRAVRIDPVDALRVE